MAINPNLILHFPFDDPDGDKAYDYSQTRADGVLSGGAFLTKNAKFGKALDLNGSGECTTATTIPLSSDFTVLMYVRPSASRIGWMLNFDGIDKYIEKWADAQANAWMSLAFVKSGNIFTTYKNGMEMQNVYLESTLIGFSLNDESVTN
jgi:hypothetical protein